MCNGIFTIYNLYPLFANLWFKQDSFNCTAMCNDKNQKGIFISLLSEEI